MSKALSQPEREAILQSFAEGHGIKATAKRLGHSDNTVRRYFPDATPPACACGRSLVHTGWCEHRLKKAASSQIHNNARGEDKMTEAKPGLAMTVHHLRVLADAAEAVENHRIRLSEAMVEVETQLRNFGVDAQKVLRPLLMSNVPGIAPVPEMPAGGGLTPVAPVETPIPPAVPDPETTEPTSDPQLVENKEPPQAANPPSRDLSIREYAEFHGLAPLVVAAAKRMGKIPEGAFVGEPPRVLVNIADRHLVRNEEGVPIGFAGNPRLPTHSEKKTLEEAEFLFQQERASRAGFRRRLPGLNGGVTVAP